MAGNSHGHTIAGWTGATIVFIGFCVAGIFTVMAEPVGFWAGVVIIALGAVVGLALRLAGFGMPAPEKSASDA
jgi:hypothetical protein